MHVGLIGLAIAVTVGFRWVWRPATATWSARWQAALVALLLPALLLGMTAITVLQMGHHGRMMGLPVGWIGCLWSLGFLGCAAGVLIYLAAQGWRSLHRLSNSVYQEFGSVQSCVIDSPSLFAAQIGFWQPQLVISQGLLQSLDSSQLHAVLTHERAHLHYRDTFWFFWLGWVNRLTAWLPNSSLLWQELLLLRELRADRWAAEQVDPLVLAETLLQVVRSPLTSHPDESLWVAFGEAVGDRLEQRIDALLSPSPASPYQPHHWLWLALGLLPLLTLPLHS